MPNTTKSQNRHPVDMLAEIREAIKKLEADERVCKEMILASGDFVGDEHVAVPKQASRKTIDRGMLEARFGKDAVAECCKETSFVTLSLFDKADIAAAVK